MANYETLTTQVADDEANIRYYNELIEWAHTPWERNMIHW